MKTEVVDIGEIEANLTKVLKDSNFSEQRIARILAA